MLQLVIKVENCHAFLKSVKINNVPENHLIITIGHKNNLQILIPVTREHCIKNMRQQLASLLDWVKP